MLVILHAKPRDWNERQGVAQTCCNKLSLSIPCVVDTMDNTVDNLYAGWPERIFVIGRDGMIAYAGKLGPLGFKPGEAERELRQLH